MLQKQLHIDKSQGVYKPTLQRTCLKEASPQLFS